MPEFDAALEYRPIPDLAGYLVGNDGSVWSRRVPGWRGGWRGRLSDAWHPLRLRAARHGHRTVNLPCAENPKGKQRYVHRLVLEAFVGFCPEGMECCHRDGDPANNRLTNLRWDTHSANMTDAARHGTMCRSAGIRKGTKFGPRREIVVVLHSEGNLMRRSRVRFGCGHEGLTWSGRGSPTIGAYGHCRVCIGQE